MDITFDDHNRDQGEYLYKLGLYLLQLYNITNQSLKFEMR